MPRRRSTPPLREAREEAGPYSGPILVISWGRFRNEGIRAQRECSGQSHLRWHARLVHTEPTEALPIDERQRRKLASLACLLGRYVDQYVSMKKATLLHAKSFADTALNDLHKISASGVQRLLTNRHWLGAEEKVPTKADNRRVRDHVRWIDSADLNVVLVRALKESVANVEKRAPFFGSCLGRKQLVGLFRHSVRDQLSFIISRSNPLADEPRHLI